MITCPAKLKVEASGMNPRSGFCQTPTHVQIPSAASLENARSRAAFQTCLLCGASILFILGNTKQRFVMDNHLETVELVTK